MEDATLDSGGLLDVKVARGAEVFRDFLLVVLGLSRFVSSLTLKTVVRGRFSCS